MAWHEQRYRLIRLADETPEPILNEVAASGAPITTPSLKAMLKASGVVPSGRLPIAGNEGRWPAMATAIQERNYANRAGSWGPPATAHIDRDGTIVRAIDPVKYAARSQGDVASPNRKIPTIAAAVASGVNMNEWVQVSIECSGAGGSGPMSPTVAARRTNQEWLLGLGLAWHRVRRGGGSGRA